MVLWYMMGKELKSEEVPVMDILNEFRALASIRGRNAHCATQPPQYDFRVKMEIDDDA